MSEMKEKTKDQLQKCEVAIEKDQEECEQLVAVVLDEFMLMLIYVMLTLSALVSTQMSAKHTIKDESQWSTWTNDPTMALVN